MRRRLSSLFVAYTRFCGPSCCGGSRRKLKPSSLRRLVLAEATGAICRAVPRVSVVVILPWNDSQHCAAEHTQVCCVLVQIPVHRQRLGLRLELLSGVRGVGLCSMHPLGLPLLLTSLFIF